MSFKCMLFAAGLVSLFSLCGCSTNNCGMVQGPDGMVVVHPEDNGKGLTNPNMGWVFYKLNCRPDLYGSEIPDDEVFSYWPGMNTIYYRIAWGYLEPKKGEYNWEIIDRSARHWIAAGKQLCFRITAKEHKRISKEGTPSWVKCGYDPDNPEFLEAFGDFLAAFAERYDGKPYVAFVDIGTIGVYGEGWAKNVKVSTKKKHLDLHRKHLPNTLLVLNDDMGKEVCEYGRKLGMSIRDDSVFWHWNLNSSKVLFDNFWPTRPTVLETAQYERLKKVDRKGGWEQKKMPWKGGWTTEYVLEAMENYHASWISVHTWPDTFWEMERDCIARVNMRIGYRLQVTEASWPGRVEPGQKEVVFNLKLRNAAVAPCYDGGYVAVTLKDRKGREVASGVDAEFNVSSLQPGPPETFGPAKSSTVAVKLPENLKSDKYGVYVSIGEKDGTPIYALPYDSKDDTLCYRLGDVKVD